MSKAEVIKMAERNVITGSAEQTSKIFGSYDFNARLIEKSWGVTLYNRSDGDGDGIFIKGEDAETVDLAARAVEALLQLSEYSE